MKMPPLEMSWTESFQDGHRGLEGTECALCVNSIQGECVISVSLLAVSLNKAITVMIIDCWCWWVVKKCHVGWSDVSNKGWRPRQLVTGARESGETVCAPEVDTLPAASSRL